MLDTGEASEGARQPVRATLEARLPAADRERAPGPNYARERGLVRALRRAYQSGNVDEIVALLTGPRGLGARSRIHGRAAL